MAGVVNLVLNRRLTGLNVDMDYGINEVGDGGSPHVSISGGTPLFEGKGHILFGGEYQNTAAIRKLRKIVLGAVNPRLCSPTAPRSMLRLRRR